MRTLGADVTERKERYENAENWCLEVTMLVMLPDSDHAQKKRTMS